MWVLKMFRNSQQRFDPIVRREMPELDTIRGLAIVMVLFYHGFFWSVGTSGFTGIVRVFVEATMPGWLGVNLFFVLSGFLITGILLDSKSKRDYFRSFYVKRALRILPAYFAVLLLLLIAGMKPRSFLILSLFFLSNVSSLFGVASSYSVLWSLSVEEHFYLLWPSFVHSFSTRTIERSAIVIACLVPILRASWFLHGRIDGLRGFTWFEADGLAMGAWLATYVRKPTFTREGLSWISGTAIVCALFSIAIGEQFGILTRQRLLGATFQETSGNLLFLGIVSMFLLIGTGEWKALIRRPVLKFYGRISYGLYLIHLLVFLMYDRHISAHLAQLLPGTGRFTLALLRFAVCVSLSTALAFLSRQYFEEPFLRMKRLWVKAEAAGIVASTAD